MHYMYTPGNRIGYAIAATKLVTMPSPQPNLLCIFRCPLEKTRALEQMQTWARTNGRVKMGAAPATVQTRCRAKTDNAATLSEM